MTVKNSVVNRERVRLMCLERSVNNLVGFLCVLNVVESSLGDKSPVALQTARNAAAIHPVKCTINLWLENSL